MKDYLFLFVAIVFEVIATSALKATHEFTKFWPSVLTLLGYVIAFYFLSLTLKTVPIGIAYALWSGIGIVLVSLLSVFLYNQKLDTAAILGISCIVLGVVIINLFSKSGTH
ncbi:MULTISPECIES: DMT family transporter [Myroides]|uniref:EamA family transporter n=1 Tax=Myroides albus TaxID=2562892 RepID=A0A6I3LL41_9FLAO|nr:MULTISPECIES: multidrug efflux SMR transporter [Myroides]MTG98236.1 EamA family transporter [Myroides albus]MVX35013.1 EamA family transporter [Myroides sp. LoEW2-1]UVD79037.1 multidrug efflux SMR transporter [Myroides albus]